jgi:hypothetical protein
MLLDKLWIRIRGELLTLKEDLFERGELRQKAEDFLERLEQKLEDDDSRADSTLDLHERLDRVRKKMEQAVNEARRESQHTSAAKSMDSSTLEELEAAWDELMKLKKKKNHVKAMPENKDEPLKSRRTLG